MGRYFVVLTDTTKQQLVKLYKSGDKILIRRIERILAELSEHPFEGIGKPEQLKYEFSGLWSRRLDEKNRLVYRVTEEIVTVFVLSVKGHYRDR